MFEFDKSKTVNSGLATITDDYRTIIFYDCPILYCGRNKQGDYIIGVSIDEDREQKKEWFAHVLVSPEELRAFMTRKISLLSLMENKGEIYLKQKSFDATTIEFFRVDLSEFPVDCRPTKDSLCPDYFLEQNADYIDSLCGHTGGSLAHKAGPHHIYEQVLMSGLHSFYKNYQTKTSNNSLNIFLNEPLFNKTYARPAVLSETDVKPFFLTYINRTCHTSLSLVDQILVKAVANEDLQLAA